MAKKENAESGPDRLTRMIAAATTGSTSSEGSGGGEDSFDADGPEEEEDDEDAALVDDQVDTSDESEDTTEEVTEESDETSDADDEDETEEPADEDGADEDTEETVEEEAQAPAPTVDPAVAAMQQQIQFLQAQVLASQQPKPALPPSAEEFDDLPDALVRGVMFGTLPRDQFDALPQNVQARLSKVYESYSAREARYAKNPALRYQEQFQSEVQKHVLSIVQPLLRERDERETDRLIGRHLAPIKTAEIRQRAVEIFQTLPGSNTTDWGTKEKLLEAAVKMARGEFHDRRVDASKKKTGAKKVQGKAAGGGKLKGAPTSKGNGKSGGIPDMKDNEKPEAYAKRIAKYLPSE